MNDHDLDIRLGEVFKRNAPSFAVPEFPPRPRPSGVRAVPAGQRHGAVRSIALAAGALVLAAAVGVGVWQAVVHMGDRGPIVVITDETSTTVTHVTEPANLVEDGQWELLVDRQARTENADTKTELLPEGSYEPVEAARVLRVVISDGGAKVLVQGDEGEYRVEGTRRSSDDGRIWYDTDASWGGRVVIWQTADGLQAEETMYGEGHPILHSYRGTLTKAETGKGTFDYVWHASVAAVNSLGPTSVTIIETKNERAAGNDSANTTTAEGPMVTTMIQLFDPPTGRAYQRMDSLVQAETLVDGPERLTIVLNNVLSSIPPVSRYRYISLQPPTGLPLPLWAGSAAGQEGYEALLTAIDPAGATSAKQVKELAGGRQRLTWEREGERWKAAFSLTLAANLLPDVIVIDGEVEGEEGRTEYTTRIEYRFDTTLSPEDQVHGMQGSKNPPDPGADEITYELPLANPTSEHADWGEYWLGPQLGEWQLTRAEHRIYQGSMQPADSLVSLVYTRATAGESRESIRVEVRPREGGTPTVSRTAAENRVSAHGWSRREGTVAGQQATIYSGPAVGLEDRITSLYVFLPDAFIDIERPRTVDGQVVLNALTELLAVMFGPDGMPTSVGKPDDWFNSAHRRYFQLYMERYGTSSVGYSYTYVFEVEGLTPEWFGFDAEDLPRIIDRLEAGAHPTYTMSLIMLLTKSDPGVDLRPRFDGVPRDENAGLREWVRAFNELKASVATKVAQRDIASLGYLALPVIYAELKSSDGEDLVALLPGVADGLAGAEEAVTAGWDKAAWLTWFEANAETLEALKSANEREIYLPWLE